MNLDEVLRATSVTKTKLSKESGLGTTTLWRAATGQPIDPKSARTLCERFPELSFEKLTLGDPELLAAHEAKNADEDAEDEEPSVGEASR